MYFFLMSNVAYILYIYVYMEKEFYVKPCVFLLTITIRTHLFIVILLTSNITIYTSYYLKQIMFVHDDMPNNKLYIIKLTTTKFQEQRRHCVHGRRHCMTLKKVYNNEAVDDVTICSFHLVSARRFVFI